MNTTLEHQPTSHLTFEREIKNTFEVLNAFSIANSDKLRWAANVYRFTPMLGRVKEQRKAIVQAAWAARKRPGSVCKGYSFVIDLDEEHVAVSTNWKLGEGLQVDDFEISLKEVVEINGTDERFSTAFAKIIKEGIKQHFKDNAANQIGPVWQDFNSFCETPSSKDAISENGFIFCKRYTFDAKETVEGWCVKFNISTASIDATSIGKYYEMGNVEELAGRISAKLENRTDRKGGPVAVRIWHSGSSANSSPVGKVYDLSSPSQILNDGRLLAAEQQKKARLEIQCNKFPDGQISLDGKKCFLLLDAAITQDDHDETILSPEFRLSYAKKVRNFVNGCNVYGVVLELSQPPLCTDQFPTLEIAPPPVYVRDARGIKILEEISSLTSESLKQRARDRQDAIRKHGFYESGQINPLLAVPHFLGQQRGDDLREKLNFLMNKMGLQYRFAGPLLYHNVSEIERAIAAGNHDSLFAVLNERFNQPQSDYDTHEQIKQGISVPSQCIHNYNVFHSRYRDRRFRDLANYDQRLARRIDNQLDLCISNLLVKCHWFPFLPAAGFRYNAHLAFDVGGKQNNQVMACLGLGFSTPERGLTFKPFEIPLHGKQAEPVHPDALYNGFLRLFEGMSAELAEDGRQLDLQTLLIFRDGPLLGSGDKWNEVDALIRLRKTALERGWTDKNGLWTAIEIMKAAEGWRVLQDSNPATNPLVGHVCFPFKNHLEGLVCTTGAPYLYQGTASPLKIRILDIAGESVREEVVRDLVWEADMCFTKPDTGLSLPLLLQIADSGALQLSRRYKISGITL